METRESVGDATVAVFHVNDDEVVACMACDLCEGGREAKEEETVEGFFTFVETSFKGFGNDSGCHGNGCR